MKSLQSQALPAPPSLTGSLKAGFDATANHIHLILLPILLDFLLWFGPHLRLDKLVAGAFADLENQPEFTAADTGNLLQLSKEFWQLLAERLNIFSALRSYPIGIPSLMMTSQPVTTPLGEVTFWQVGSVTQTVVLWVVISIIGLSLGTLYFAMISQVITEQKIVWRSLVRDWPWMSVQVLLLTVLLALVVITLSIPFSCLISALFLTGFPVGQISLLIFGVVALWILLPFFFSPHGIFVNRSPMLKSVRDSLMVTRTTMPKTTLFFLILLAIDEGLTILWRVPEENTWLAAVGIAGHAFVTTGILAASFVYYLDARRWVRRLVQQTQLSSKAS